MTHIIRSYSLICLRLDLAQMVLFIQKILLKNFPHRQQLLAQQLWPNIISCNTSWSSNNPWPLCGWPCPIVLGPCPMDPMDLAQLVLVIQNQHQTVVFKIAAALPSLASFHPPPRPLFFSSPNAITIFTFAEPEQSLLQRKHGPSSQMLWLLHSAICGAR